MSGQRGRPSKERAALIDDEAIEGLWLNGVSVGEISRRYPISARAVQAKAAREGWDVEKRRTALSRKVRTSDAMPQNFAPPEGVPPPRPKLVEIALEDWIEMIMTCGEWGERFPLAEMGKTLENVASGMPIGLACEAAGLSERVVLGFRNEQPKLDSLFKRARALAAKALTEKITGDKDWRAAAWALERAAAREEFRPPDQKVVGDAKMVIEVEFRRDDPVALAEVKMIDVTPIASPEGDRDGEVEPDALPAGIAYAKEPEPDAKVEAGLSPIPEAEDLPRGEAAADPLRRRRRGWKEPRDPNGRDPLLP